MARILNRIKEKILVYEKIDKDDKLLRCAASNFRDDLRMHDYVYGHISGNSKKGGEEHESWSFARFKRKDDTRLTRNRSAGDSLVRQFPNYYFSFKMKSARYMSAIKIPPLRE